MLKRLVISNYSAAIISAIAICCRCKKVNWVLNAATQGKQQPCVQWYQIKAKPCWALRTQLRIFETLLSTFIWGFYWKIVTKTVWLIKISIIKKKQSMYLKFNYFVHKCHNGVKTLKLYSLQCKTYRYIFFPFL